MRMSSKHMSFNVAFLVTSHLHIVGLCHCCFALASHNAGKDSYENDVGTLPQLPPMRRIPKTLS